MLAASCHIGSILSQFNQQNLSLALWAFAKLGWRPDTSLLADACKHALLTVQTINPQNLANILWALATLDFVPSTALLEVGSKSSHFSALPESLPNYLACHCVYHWNFVAMSVVVVITFAAIVIACLQHALTAFKNAKGEQFV